MRGQKAFSSNDLYFLSIEDSRVASGKGEEGRGGEDYLKKVGGEIRFTDIYVPSPLK